MEKSMKSFNYETGASHSMEIPKVFNQMVQKISESKQTSRKADENVSIAQKRPSCVFSFQIFNSEKERISSQSRLISNSNVSSEANCVFLHERKIEQRDTNSA